jgi:hypothetical protein
MRGRGKEREDKRLERKVLRIQGEREMFPEFTTREQREGLTAENAEGDGERQ